jgi:hypothetical protein
LKGSSLGRAERKRGMVPVRLLTADCLVEEKGQDLSWPHP